MAKNNYDKYYKEAAKNLETSKKEEFKPNVLLKKELTANMISLAR